MLLNLNIETGLRLKYNNKWFTITKIHENNISAESSSNILNLTKEKLAEFIVDGTIRFCHDPHLNKYIAEGYTDSNKIVYLSVYENWYPPS